MVCNVLWCLLFAVCCLLFVVCCALCAVSGSLFVVGRVLIAVGCLVRAVRCGLSVADWCCLLFVAVSFLFGLLVADWRSCRLLLGV